MDKIHAFYTSKAWRDLSYMLKVQRGGKDERTGEVIEDYSQLIGHHKVELTEDNVDDAMISLNPANIEIISIHTHNIEHHRDWTHKSRVYLVYGAPLSGKTAYVQQVSREGDLILDINNIWTALTNGRSNRCKYNVFAVRDLIYDQIKTRYGQWYDAYVIGTYADRYARERAAKELNAELIYIEATKEECINRAAGNEDYIGYINKWYDTYDRTKG